MDALSSDSGSTDDRGLLPYLDRWLADYSGPPDLVLGLGRGNERSECAVAWLTAEGPAAFGSLTLWGSGDVASEVYDAHTAGLLLLDRGRASTIAELAVYLCAFVAGCAPVTEARSAAGAWARIGSATLGETPSIQRRLHR